MPKINVYLPDDLADAVRDAGVPVSAVCQRALDQAVRRITAIREVTTTGASWGGALPDPPVVNFTRRAMSALLSARTAAGAEGVAETGTEHLLRALLAHGGIAVEVLTALEITPHQIRAALDQRVPPAPAPAPAPAAPVASDPAAGDPVASDTVAAGGTAAEPALSRQLAAVLELAANESSGLGNRYIGSEHLLLGLIGEPDGVARSVLRSLGADQRVTRRTVAAALAGWAAGVSGQQQRAAEQAAAVPVPDPGQLSAAIRAELAPLLARLGRLERAAAD
jgi:ATP-dependent Clp protease ATP-binding subunit ClpA